MIFQVILKVNAKCTSLFSVVHEIDTSANNLNHDLEKNSEYAFQWKMKFNPDPGSRNNI